MYLAMTYEWHAVLGYHGAEILEIERGHAAWGDSFHHLDARILQGHFKSSSTNVHQSTPKDLRPVFFASIISMAHVIFLMIILVCWPAKQNPPPYLCDLLGS